MSDSTFPPPSSEPPRDPAAGEGDPGSRPGPFTAGVPEGLPFRPRSRAPSVPVLFVGGLAIVAAVTGVVLAVRPKPARLASANPYELPEVRGLVRTPPHRAPRPVAVARGSEAADTPGKSPDAVAPAPEHGPGPAPAVAEAPPIPVFAPPSASAVPARPPQPEEPVGPASAPRAPDLPVPVEPPPSSIPTPEPTPTPAAPPGLDPALPVVPPVDDGTEPGPAVFAGPSATRAPTPPQAAPTTGPTREGPADWRVLVTGERAEGVASEASRLAEDRRLVTPRGRALRFSARAGEPAGMGEGVRFVVEGRPAGLTLTEVRIAEPLDDPLAALVPPRGLVSDVLVGVPLEVPPAARGSALAALSLLLSGDGAAAAALLDPKATAPGLRVLLAYALLLKGELPRVHDLLFGLGDDPTLGVVARFLTGAALLTDRNPREAIRDFQAALRLQPAFWPARLLEAESNARLDLPEAAAKGFQAVRSAVPDRPEVVLSNAYYLAGTDRAAAVLEVTRLVDARPDLVPAWWMLGWIRRQGDTSEDAQAEVKAFRTVAFLRPKDADAWRELGTAELRWADVAGGLDARRAAAEAFASEVALHPKDGLAWFNRGSVLHQLATDVPLSGDPAAFAERLSEVRTCYARALEAGTLSRPDAARVHHNMGLVIDLLPSGAGGAKAAAAYQASVDADPTYAQGALALVAARVAERDASAAAKALARVPGDADAAERSVLAAAVRWVSGDAAGAAAALREAGESPQAAGDVALRVLGSLVVTGFRRAALTLLEAEPADGPRLTLRVRARAGLRDVLGLRNDLATLGRLDAKLAERLRARDPEVGATLGSPAARGTLEERLR